MGGFPQGRRPRKVIIHAGVHRTGTTSLQMFLSENRPTLGARDIAYPGTGVSHQDLVWSLKRGESGIEEVDTLVVEAENAGTVVLSGEDFSTLTDLDWLPALADRHEIHAVFYLRRQDHWLMSWYNQHVKWPFVRYKSRMDPDAFLETIEDYHWLDYATLLDRWTAVLGPGRVSAGAVEPGQIEDVTQDFLDKLGITQPPASTVVRINDSLPTHILEIARNLGLIDLNPEQRSCLLAALRTGLEGKVEGAPNLYTPHQRQQILDRFTESNRKVAQAFFGRDMLFFEPTPADDAPYFRFPDLSREQLLRQWIAPVIRELLRPR